MASPDSTTITDAQGISWVAKQIEKMRRNWFLIVIGVGAYSAGGGSGSLVTSHTGSSSLRTHVDSIAGVIQANETRIEIKVDRVLAIQKDLQGAFLKLPDGPGALKKYHKEQLDRGFDPWMNSRLKDTANAGLYAAKGERK